MLMKIETPAWIATGRCSQGHEVQAVVPSNVPANYAGREAESYCPECKEKVMLLVPEKPSSMMTFNYKP